MAFAGPIAAFSATQKTPDKFTAIFRFGITPLFLFSGTFFPISSLPAVLQAVAWVTPLFHGVALTRALSLGTVARRPDRDARARHLPDDPCRRWRVPDDQVHRPPAGPLMTALRITPVFAIGSRRSIFLIERNMYVYRHTWIVILSGFFEPLFYLVEHRLRSRRARRHGAGSRRRADQLPAVRRPGTAGDGIDERRHHRDDVQLLLQAQLQQDVHVDPRDADVARRRGRGRAQLGADPRRAVRGRVRRGHAPARACSSRRGSSSPFRRRCSSGSPSAPPGWPRRRS